jgi:hypothetical protein
MIKESRKNLNPYMLSVILSIIAGFWFSLIIIDVEGTNIYYKAAFLLLFLLTGLAVSYAVLVFFDKTTSREKSVIVIITHLLMFFGFCWVFSIIRGLFSADLAM